MLHYKRQSPRRGVISVCEYPYPISRALQLRSVRSKYELSFKNPEHEYSNSQDLETFYHDAGQFYILSREYFNKHKKIFVPKVEPIILDRMKVCDIDTMEDWREAEFKYKYLKEKGEL
jgi:N-acylneuraminate cytidylyltransferase